MYRKRLLRVVGAINEGLLMVVLEGMVRVVRLLGVVVIVLVTCLGACEKLL